METNTQKNCVLNWTLLFGGNGDGVTMGEKEHWLIRFNLAKWLTMAVPCFTVKISTGFLGWGVRLKVRTEKRRFNSVYFSVRTLSQLSPHLKLPVGKGVLHNTFFKGIRPGGTVRSYPQAALDWRWVVDNLMSSLTWKHSSHSRLNRGKTDGMKLWRHADCDGLSRLTSFSVRIFVFHVYFCTCEDLN